MLRAVLADESLCCSRPPGVTVLNSLSSKCPHLQLPPRESFMFKELSRSYDSFKCARLKSAINRWIKRHRLKKKHQILNYNLHTYCHWSTSKKKQTKKQPYFQRKLAYLHLGLKAFSISKNATSTLVSSNTWPECSMHNSVLTKCFIQI